VPAAEYHFEGEDEHHVLLGKKNNHAVERSV
jgi:hypothetical protein